MKLTYPAVFTFYKEDNSYSVEFPDLPGCASGGSTLEDAMTMGIDAASGWILTELEAGKQIPKASNIKDIHTEKEESFVTLLLLNMDTYIAKYSKKAVRKNVTIPRWLDAAAEKMHINFSEVLQNALIQQLTATV